MTCWSHFKVPPPPVQLFIIFINFRQFWTKMRQGVAAARDPKAKTNVKRHFKRKIQKLLSAAGHTHDKRNHFNKK